MERIIDLPFKNKTMLLDLFLYNQRLLFSSNQTGKSLFLEQKKTSLVWKELKLSASIDYQNNAEEIVYMDGKVTNIPENANILCLADSFLLGLHADPFVIFSKIDRLV